MKSVATFTSLILLSCCFIDFALSSLCLDACHSQYEICKFGDKMTNTCDGLRNSCLALCVETVLSDETRKPLYTPVTEYIPLIPLNNLRFCREACSSTYLYCIDGNNELLPVDKDQACYHSCIIEQDNRIMNYPTLYEQIGLQYESCVNACKLTDGPVKKVRAIVNLRLCYEDKIRYEWCVSS